MVKKSQNSLFTFTNSEQKADNVVALEETKKFKTCLFAVTNNEQKILTFLTSFLVHYQ